MRCLILGHRPISVTVRGAVASFCSECNKPLNEHADDIGQRPPEVVYHQYPDVEAFDQMPDKAIIPALSRETRRSGYRDFEEAP